MPASDALFAERPARGHYAPSGASLEMPPLSLRLLTPYLLIFLALGVPLVAWSGAYDPRAWQSWATEWPDPVATGLVIALVGSLLVIPLAWVVWRRTMDVLSLALAQAALVFAGYFYMDQTAAHLPESTFAILGTTGLVVAFNALGFLCFFAALGLSYFFVAKAGYRLAPASAPPEVLDAKFLFFVRVASLLCAASIALPMVLTRTVPLLSANGTEARLDLVMQSDAGRAIYHMGTALLPFVVATLITMMIRQPKRVLGWDGAVTLVVVVLQLLTSNRLPLSIALMVTLCLLTTQYRLPRWLLVGSVLAYLFLFTFLSGFTSLLRANPQALRQGTWFNESIEQAYLGDNIIDLRDGAWVFSQWDYHPLLGKTYLGGLVSMLPSGMFPEKKQWHLGLTGVRIVGLPEDEHFGLRMTFFGEAFLNFGWAGVTMLGLGLGAAYGVVLRQYHLAASEPHRSSICRSVMLLILLQCGLPLTNTSDAFIFWVLLAVLGLIMVFVLRPAERATLRESAA